MARLKLSDLFPVTFAGGHYPRYTAEDLRRMRVDDWDPYENFSAPPGATYANTPGAPPLTYESISEAYARMGEEIGKGFAEGIRGAPRLPICAVCAHAGIAGMRPDPPTVERIEQDEDEDGVTFKVSCKHGGPYRQFQRVRFTHTELQSMPRFDLSAGVAFGTRCTCGRLVPEGTACECRRLP